MKQNAVNNMGFYYMVKAKFGRNLLLPLMMLIFLHGAHAADMNSGVVLETLEYDSLPGESVQLRLGLSAPIEGDIPSFTIENPARLSFDLPGTRIGLDKKSMDVGAGVLTSIRTVQAKDKTRVVLSLSKNVPYQIRSEANAVYVNLNAQMIAANKAVTAVEGGVSGTVDEIDFRRGMAGEGKVTIEFSDPSTVLNMQEKGKKILVDFVNTNFPQKLIRRLDVTDFATPVNTIDAFNTDSGARLVLDTSGDYEHMAYQTGSKFVIDVRPITPEEVAEAKKDKFGYSGEKLSLNFQNIEVRAVLQLLADFTGLNVVASDSVQGNITLRLKNVPWDQALDIILKTRGLGMRKTGNVVLIAPNDEIVEREEKEMKAEQQKLQLAPVKTRYHQINYAKAKDIARMLKAEKNSILTDRGSVTIDERTNTLMVLETAEKHEEIAALIAQLDVPVRQVMIESRIVVASDDFSKDIGVRAGYTKVQPHDVGSGQISGISTVTGSAVGGDTMTASAINNLASGGGSPYPVTLPTLSNRYNVNLPAPPSAGRIALALLGSDYLVDLELSALQTEGKGELLSNPRVITSNQTEALIEQGVDIPYQEASSSGATSTSFKKAVLSLKVTPQITPDDRVKMDLEVKKDDVGGIYGGVPSINTSSVTTQVLVDNGDTIVLGGIYEQNTAEGVSKVPLLGDIPILGHLFKSTTKSMSKGELLIFVTPRILSEKLALDF